MKLGAAPPSAMPDPPDCDPRDETDDDPPSLDELERDKDDFFASQRDGLT